MCDEPSPKPEHSRQRIGIICLVITLVMLAILIALEFLGKHIPPTAEFYSYIFLSLTLSITMGVWLGTGNSSGTINIPLVRGGNDGMKLDFNLIGGIGAFVVCMALLVTLKQIHTLPKSKEAWQLSDYLRSTKIADNAPEGNFYMLHRKGKNGPISVADKETTLTMEDSYQVYIRMAEEGYAYVFQYEQGGQLNVIFPELDGAEYSSGSNPIQAEEQLYLPARNSSFHLTPEPSIESLVLVATSRRLPAFENLLIQAESQGSDFQSKELSINKRAIGGIRLDTPAIPSDLVHLKNELSHLEKGTDGILIKEVKMTNKGIL